MGRARAQTQLRRTLHEVLPDDVHLRAKDRGWVSALWVERFRLWIHTSGVGWARGNDVVSSGYTVAASPQHAPLSSL